MKKIKFHAIVLGTTFMLVSALSLSSEMLPNEDRAAEKLNEAAETYVKLGLELGEYDTDYVDAYIGPKQWKHDAKKNLRSKQKLAKDIAALLKELKNLSPSNKELITRHKALFRNVRAMDVRIRMVNGEKFSFAEEARLIYDVTLPKYDFTEFDKVLDEIDKLIPGDGDLASRVDAFRETFIIPEKQVNAIFERAIEECRQRSAKYIQLPDNESLTLEYVTNKSWSAYNSYQGNNNSLAQMNLDFPIKIDKAVDLGCHEGYPGHHVWNVLVETNLLNKNGWIEFSIYPLFSPYALIGEGSANYGVELAFPDEEKVNFESDVLYPMASLDSAKAESLNKLNKLTTKLSHVRTATAQLYLDGKITREQAIEQRRIYGLMSKEEAEMKVRFIEQYRSYVLNYNLGKDIVSEYINKQGDTPDARWRAFERMLTELSTASDMRN